MRIVIISAFYSRGMGYTENCLPRALAALGHEVHVVTSTFNVYANAPDYESTYGAFLGDARQPQGEFEIDGYRVHRIDAVLVGGYVRLRGLGNKLKSIDPDIVHSTEVASLQTFSLAAQRPFARWRLFVETHQHMSVVKPFLKGTKPHRVARSWYWLTRTVPTALASRSIEKCYAIAPDCVEVATRFYGVPPAKITLQSLGTDTDLFRPAQTDEEQATRNDMRSRLGFGTRTVVIYTGRFSDEKAPLLLAEAIETLVQRGHAIAGLFVGEGPQRAAIELRKGSKVVPFATHGLLADYYRCADIAVWPTQESMSMLDAAASGLPLIVSDLIGENERVVGNGRTYHEGDSASLADVLISLLDPKVRKKLGLAGREKMVTKFSWRSTAQAIELDYCAALGA